MHQKPRHFFAATMTEWRVDEDIEHLIRKMRANKDAFSLWYVPTAVNQDYEIEYFAPKVDGAVFLTTIYPKTK